MARSRMQDGDRPGRIADSFRIDPASTQPLARQLAKALRRAIVSTRLTPGEMLSEQEIASALGISRQPIREAIINLRELGLVRVYPQRGTQIAPISLKAVEDARFIRETLECAVVREAARLADSTDLGRLRDCIAVQRQCSAKGDADAFFEADEAFHRLLAGIAGREAAWEVVETVKPQMDRVRFLDARHAAAQESIIAEHARIVDAIGANDTAEAGQLMADHLRTIRTSVLLVKANNPHLFEAG